MQDFLQFVLQHPLLWILFFVILGLIVWFETRSTIGGVTRIIAASAVQLINRENAAVIDIRDPNAYKEGHIVGSSNIPFAKLADKNKSLQRFREKPVIMVCAMGQSSMKAAQILKKQGFEKVYSLQGGINAWKSSGFPVEKN